MSEGSSLPVLVLGAAAVGGFVWLSRTKDAESRDLVTAAAERARADLGRQVMRAQREDLDAKLASIEGRPPPLSTTPYASHELPPLISSARGSDGRLSPYRFDTIFAQLGRGIPVAYLRALARAESGLNADDPKGLINVVPIALADYHRRHPAARISAARLQDPIANVIVAVDILRTIIKSYATNHPSVVNLREDWTNPRYVALLTAGWNAGFSERGGVGRVVRHLLARGVTDITVDRVFAAAPAAGAASTLANPAKLAFAHKVTAAYFREARA